jgi:hypothetical protein
MKMNIRQTVSAAPTVRDILYEVPGMFTVTLIPYIACLTLNLLTVMLTFADNTPVSESALSLLVNPDYNVCKPIKNKLVDHVVNQYTNWPLSHSNNQLT